MENGRLIMYVKLKELSMGPAGSNVVLKDPNCKACELGF